MKLTFTESGGLLGKTKKAEINVDMTDKEYQTLIKKIAATSKKAIKKTKDAFIYNLSNEGDDKLKAISINNIPDEYSDLFDDLFKALTYTKG